MLYIRVLAKLLQTTEKNAEVRAAKMRLLPTCGRCGGSGQYSFCATHGTRCFGCGGSGQRRAKTKGKGFEAEQCEIIARAEAAVAEGQLARYLEGLAARKRAKGAKEAIFKAWRESKVARAYEKLWRQLGEHKGEPEWEKLRAAQFAVAKAQERAFKAIYAAEYPKAAESATELWLEAEAQIKAFYATVAEVEYECPLVELTPA